MPNVLTRADALACKYGGTIVPGDSKLVAAGNAVLTEAGVMGKTVTACGAGGSQQPLCTTITAITVGKATKLTVGGAAVLVSGMTAATDQPAPHVVGPISAGQSKLVAS